MSRRRRKKNGAPSPGKSQGFDPTFGFQTSVKGSTAPCHLGARCLHSIEDLFGWRCDSAAVDGVELASPIQMLSLRKRPRDASGKPVVRSEYGAPNRARLCAPTASKCVRARHGVLLVEPGHDVGIRPDIAKPPQGPAFAETGSGGPS
jgi:hypothetical protein